jgi:hypothetical protein
VLRLRLGFLEGDVQPGREDVTVITLLPISSPSATRSTAGRMSLISE